MRGSVEEAYVYGEVLALLLPVHVHLMHAEQTL